MSFGREANFALGWPARTAALLMVVSTIITYFDSQSRGNPNAVLHVIRIFTFNINRSTIPLF